MYEANGIVLTSSEAKKLIELVDSDDPRKVARHDLHNDDWKNIFPDEEMSRLYIGLYEKGLIDGKLPYEHGFIFGSVKYAGRDWVHDYFDDAEAERKRLRRSDRHDFYVAALGSVLGGILGLFGGALAGWLVSLIP